MRIKNISQNDLARARGVTHAAISRKLSGHMRWTLQDVIFLSDFFKIPLSSFISNEVAPAVRQYEQAREQ